MRNIDVKLLLHLVDVVWSTANEDESVPSTKWAKEMIETAKKRRRAETNIPSR